MQMLFYLDWSWSAFDRMPRDRQPITTKEIWDYRRNRLKTLREAKQTKQCQEIPS